MRKLLRLENLVNFNVWMKFVKRGDALFINHGSIEVGHSFFFTCAPCPKEESDEDVTITELGGYLSLIRERCIN